MNVVHKANSGLFYRKDKNFGLLIYSPFSGLFFSCLETNIDTEKLIDWINKKPNLIQSDLYQKSIGAGWFLPIEESSYPEKKILSSINKELEIQKPNYPILINWLITEQCTCDCQYCYAQDIMNKKYDKYDSKDIENIANRILKYNPIAVVLTGGEPLISPFLNTAIEKLNNRTGIIIDTNGIGMTQSHINLFKKYNIFVRISLDSELPKINNYLRPVKSNHQQLSSLESALECINLCKKNDIKFGIQTVITNKNLSDIESLGDKFYKLEITNWRIQLLANHSCFKDYNSLVPNKTRFYKTIWPALKKKNKNIWHERIAIQLLKNNESNAVVLVSPNGEFLTEYKGKKLIDPQNPKSPSVKSFKEGTLNLDAHSDRYLNISDASEKHITS